MNNDLHSYIKENLSRGVSQETIKNTLLSAGWQSEVVLAAFAEFQKDQNVLPMQTTSGSTKINNPQSSSTSSNVQTGASQAVVSMRSKQNTQKSQSGRTLLLRSPMFFLQTGLAFVFFYAAIAIYFNPTSYMHFIPTFVTNFIPVKTFFTIYMIYEVVLAERNIISLL